MMLNKALKCDEEYYRCFCRVSYNGDIKRYRDDILKGRYYHNFSIIEGELSKKELAKKVGEEVQFRKDEEADFCNIFLDRVYETNLENLIKVKSLVSLSGYYAYDIGKIDDISAREDVVLKRGVDEDTIHDMVYADFEKDADTLGKERFIRRAKRKSEVYESDAGVDIYGCYYNQDIVGTCELFIEDKCAKIEDFMIIERFQRKGFGTALIKELMKEAVLRGAEYIYLMTDEDDTAKEMYRKLGFEKVGEKNELFFKLV